MSHSPVTRHDLCVGRLPAQVLHHMEVTFNHFDNGPPPATRLLVTGPGVDLTNRNFTLPLTLVVICYRLNTEMEVILTYLDLLLLLELMLSC